MGLIFGLVASPCATPILAVILMLGVSGADPVFSGGLLLSYAIGHWALVMVAGISVSSAQRLLESPRWARAYDWTRKAAGGLLIATGIYLIVSLFIG
jgi:cytochrome c-type biogenesis protein